MYLSALCFLSTSITILFSGNLITFPRHSWRKMIKNVHVKNRLIQKYNSKQFRTTAKRYFMVLLSRFLLHSTFDENLIGFSFIS